jgi:aspartyl-tRNA(Asn)/glutamyl-tRNA(Gln) amidotransferase subunit A
MNVLELADENVRAATEATAEVFRSLGAIVVPATYPDLDLAGAMRPIGVTESYSYHATDLAELPKKYGTLLEARTKTGGLYLASEYIEAQRARAIVRSAVKAMFDGLDMLLCPTMPTEPPTYERSLEESWGRRPGITNLFNQTGQPALAFPSGFSESGLPLSVQLVGRPFGEATLLAGAHAYQGVTDWHKRHPAIS